MQQQAFQNYADELRKGLRELRKAEVSGPHSVGRHICAHCT